MGRQFNSVQCVGWFLSHFSTAGLCNMPVGVFSQPLLTTGDYGIQAERGSSLLQGGSGIMNKEEFPSELAAKNVQ